DVEGLNLLGEVAGGLGNAAGLGEELRRWTSASAAELKGQAVGAGIASLVGSVGQDALAFGQIGGLLGSLLTKSPEEKAAEAERQRQLEAQQREFTRRVAAQFNAQGAGSPVAQRREWRGGDPDAAGRDTTEIKVRIPRQESRWRSGGVPLTTETPSVAPPYSTAPDLSDWTDLDRAVALGYPAELRDSGVGGSVNVWVFVERGGGVLDMRLDHTSGHADLDLAAMRILKTLSFEPARREGEPVGAWISVPVTFRATNPRVPIGGWTN
ncbi:MAG: energy transducer TonB, partial [Gemmatimonadetes bacterium]|nr:energy transducer TonB [Gemmatimonadota bacterium]